MYKQICPKVIPSVFKVSGVYCISLGEHFYIGSSKNIQQRISQHRKKLRANKHQSKFQMYYNTLGESKMYINILEICKEQDIRKREKYWIEALNPDINYEKIYNTTPQIVIFNGTGSKKVYQYTMNGDFIKEFPSVKEAARVLNVDNRGIGLCAADKYSHYKSAYGYRWSYVKLPKLSVYINNSSKAVNRKVIIFDILTGEETSFESIAEAVRILEPNAKNFDSSCATLSSVANKYGYYLGHYLAKNTYDDLYIISKRNTVIYNRKTNKIYKNILKASEDTKISVRYLKKACITEHTEWFYMNQCARVKLSESGKLFIDKTTLIQASQKCGEGSTTR